MKRFLIFALACILLGTVQTSSRAQMQTGAASRRTDRAPYQITFGPLTTVAPFNQANNYTAITTETQLFPDTLWTNNFSSTGSFTNTSSTGSPATFSVSGNVGTLTASGATNNFLQDTQTSFTSPLASVQLEVDQNAAAVAATNIGVGLCKDDNNGIFVIKTGGASMFVRARVAGVNTDTTINNTNTMPSPPWKLAFTLTGGVVDGWINSGSGWVSLSGTSVASTFDPRTDGNLTGYNACIIQNTDRAGTWQISNLKTGFPGGSGLRDISLVRHDDGRPLYIGTKVYFTATTTVPTNGAYDGVWSYDFGSSTLSWVGAILDDISGVQYTDVASQLIYNDVTQTYRYLVGGWGHQSFPNVNTFYKSFSKSTTDPLAGGVHVVTGAAILDLPYVATTFYGWDAHMACTAFNYLTGACGNWLLGYAVASGTTSYHPGLVSTTSDPSVNSWTSIAQDTGYSSTEGARIIRVNSPTGVQYYPSFGGSSNSTVKYQQVYDSSLNRLGLVNATLPASSLNAPHPEVFSYGNNTYLFTFNNNAISNGGNNSAGNLLMASAPRYSSGNSTFQLATNFITGTASSISTATFSVDKGSTIAAFCRGPGTTGITLTASSSPSATWNTVASVPGVTGTTAAEIMAYAVAPADQMSVTCTPSASASNMGIIVLEVPATTTIDASATWTGTFAAALTATSGTWSTAEPATGLFCITTFTNSTQFFQAGNMAGIVSNLSANDGARSSCESLVMSSAQTSQTAAISWTGSSVQSTAIFGAFH